MTERHAWMVISTNIEMLAWAFFVAWVCGFNVMYARPRFFLWRTT